MKPTFTKGPWRVGMAHGIKGVYNIDCGEISSEEDHANCKLIASSPDLYKALKRVLALMNEEGREYWRAGLVNEIEAALKKAETNNE